MNLTVSRKEPSFPGICSGSVLLHILLLLIIARFSLMPGDFTASRAVYEVDLLNLPVAEPSTSPPPAASPMHLPTPGPTQKAANASPEGESEDFSRRIAELERKADARHQAGAIARLRQHAADGQPGIPTGTGTEQGSDYTSYLHSRLADAFRTTIAFQTRDPEVVIRLLIDGKGRVVASRIERSTGDRLFEDAALRAIAKAARLLVPPPGGGTFEHGFVFRPQGIGTK